MPQIQPFRGYFYDQTKVNLHDVVAPPYDVISPEQQEKLYERSPYNIVRLILGREEDPYASSARYLREWTERSILKRDQEPSVYVLSQTFDAPGGKRQTREGLIALCKLEDFENKIVLPHEKTLAKPREDRFNLFKATNANLSQVFSLYSDPEDRIERLMNGLRKTPPVIDVVFEDVENRLWRLRDRAVISKIQGVLEDKQVLIADGHHRYETALAYRDFMRTRNLTHTGREPYNYVMMYFTNVDREGLVVYPTHRLVHSVNKLKVSSFLEQLQRHFIMRDLREPEALLRGLESSPVKSFGLMSTDDSSCRLLTLKPSSSLSDVIKDPLPQEVKELDVTLLHNLILRDMLGISVEAQEQKRNIEYIREATHAFAAVRKGTAQLAFFMNPTRIDQVRSIAKAGYTMPQKSTYFYPKLVSGLVFHRLEP